MEWEITFIFIFFSQIVKATCKAKSGSFVSLGSCDIKTSLCYIYFFPTNSLILVIEIDIPMQ